MTAQQQIGKTWRNDWIAEVRDATTPQEMRAELFRLRFDDPLVRACLDAGDYSGMSAEDKYTVLAYNAVKQKCHLQRVIADYMAITPMPPFIFKQGEPGL